MPFSVLKIPKARDGMTEVAGEFPEADDAQRFVEEMLSNDPSDEHEFVVEAPPSHTG